VYLADLFVKFRIVFWDVLPCKVIVDRRFRGTCCLSHQVDNYFTRQYIAEDKSELHSRRRENLKSHRLVVTLKVVQGQFTRQMARDGGTAGI
jgi:hypothetical protein